MGISFLIYSFCAFLNILFLIFRFQVTHDRGFSWSLFTNSAPWYPRQDSSIVYYKEEIYIIGGKNTIASVIAASTIWMIVGLDLWL